MFGLAAAMYAIFVVSVQSVPETYDRSPDALPLPGEAPPPVNGAHAAATAQAN